MRCSRVIYAKLTYRNLEDSELILCALWVETDTEAMIISSIIKCMIYLCATKLPG